MNFWAWGGKYIGKRIGDYLYLRNGEPIGVFVENELYNFDGYYIGEIRNEKRIIVKKSKKNKKRERIRKPMPRMSSIGYCDYCGYVMYAGYEDFLINEE